MGNQEGYQPGELIERIERAEAEGDMVRFTARFPPSLLRFIVEDDDYYTVAEGVREALRELKDAKEAAAEYRRPRHIRSEKP